ncbi:MAG: OmpA/MotB family protein [Acidimicrobiales bacterium]
MARRRPHVDAEEEGPSRERWLLTYSDMITLLMVLFIVLFALGQTDIRKFDAFRDSFRPIQEPTPNTPPGGPGVLSAPAAIALEEQNAFAMLTRAIASASATAKQLDQQHSGKTASGQDQPGEPNQALQAAEREYQTLNNAERAMENALVRAGLANEVTFNIDQRGLVVTILTDKILFPTDSAQLQPEGVKILNVLAPVLASLPNLIDVEGDTDNQPIRGGPYPDNWALSAARAVAVVEDLIHEHGINPDRLQATGNSDTRPVVPNNTPQHRAENRRVEIVVYSTTLAAP